MSDRRLITVMNFLPHYFSFTHLQLDVFISGQQKYGCHSGFLSLCHRFLIAIFRCKTYFQRKNTPEQKAWILLLSMKMLVHWSLSTDLFGRSGLDRFSPIQCPLINPSLYSYFFHDKLTFLFAEGTWILLLLTYRSVFYMAPCSWWQQKLLGLALLLSVAPDQIAQGMNLQGVRATDLGRLPKLAAGIGKVQGRV